MKFPFLFLNYIAWHYSTAISDLVVNLKNLLKFVIDFFSLPDLVKTLFSPWRRMGEAYPDRFDPTAFMTALVINTMMRIVGFVMRLIVLAVGLVALVVSVLLAVSFFIIWLFIPLVVFALIVYGLFYLFS